MPTLRASPIYQVRKASDDWANDVRFRVGSGGTIVAIGSLAPGATHRFTLSVSDETGLSDAATAEVSEAALQEPDAINPLTADVGEGLIGTQLGDGQGGVTAAEPVSTWTSPVSPTPGTWAQARLTPSDLPGLGGPVSSEPLLIRTLPAASDLART